MKILNEVIKEKPDSKHIDLCCNGVQILIKKKGF